MIITRTPYRLSFAGGGTDLADYYRTGYGAVVSTTIDKYVYICVKESFAGNIVLHYSDYEVVGGVDEIKHPLFREAFRKLGIGGGLEIASLADIPGGTGLGSSGTFTVGLLKALHAYKGEDIDAETLAEEAIDIEINRLHSPIGKQDQYAAAFGGLNYYKFNGDGKIDVKEINISASEKKTFSDNLILLYTGITRSADKVLAKQKENTGKNMAMLDFLKGQASELKSHLETNGADDELGKIFDRGWQQKKKLASNISSGEIDKLYADALAAGAVGGRVVGAGGGGFLLFYCPPEKQEAVVEKTGLRNIVFNFEERGSQITYQS